MNSEDEAGNGDRGREDGRCLLQGKIGSLGIGGLKGKKETLDFSVDFLGRVY